MDEPTIIDGKFTVDDRGTFNLFNFEPKDIKRFYFMGTHKAGFVRAWHGHKNEAKYAVCIKGAATIGVVKVDDWKEPKNTDVKAFVLSDTKSEILFIPAGYANGIKFLTNDTRVLFFSTSTTAESIKDDYRFSATYWNIWGDQWR